MFRQMKSFTAICLLLLVLMRCAGGTRSLKTARGEGEIESVRVDMADERVLRLFNLTSDQLRKLAQGGGTVKSGSSSTATDNERFVNVKEYRIGDIRNKIQMAITGGATPPSDNSKDQPHHEMAAYPICSSETTWQDEPNVTLRFRDNLFESRKNNLYLDRAILRIYKLNPTNSMLQSTEHPKVCPDTSIDAQIRITVSIITKNKNRREKKKRICNSFMMNVSHTGWIEIDVKRAIHIWENVDQQRANPPLVGLFMLEVHDEEERPLNPGHFFGPPLCDQADHAIPWNVYGSYSAMPLSYTGQVPRSPRIDITLIGYASTIPRARHGLNADHELYRLSNRKREESTTSITPTDNLLDQSASTEIHRHRQRHARHHHHHAHISPATIADGDTAEATVATGSIRLDTSAEERQTLDC